MADFLHIVIAIAAGPRALGLSLLSFLSSLEVSEPTFVQFLKIFLNTLLISLKNTWSKVTHFKLIDKAHQKAQGSCEIYPLRLSELVVVHWTYFCHKKLEASLYLLKPLSKFTPLYCN